MPWGLGNLGPPLLSLRALVDPCAGGARGGSGLNQTLLTGSPTVGSRVTHRWFVACTFVFEAKDERVCRP